MNGIALRAAMNRDVDATAAWIGIVIGIFIAATLGIALAYDFPSLFDELQQYSVIRGQFLNPDIFADPRNFLVLNRENLAVWTETKNNINHPSLYYLMLAPFTSGADGVLALRIVNVVIATSALILVIAAGFRLFETATDRIIFAVIAACFPKAMLIGGMINNDNMAALAAALVFAGLARMPGDRLLILIGLALAGWTKLTALVALSFLVAIWLLLEPRKLFQRKSFFAASGVLIGLVPHVAMWFKTSHLVPVSAMYFYTPPELRPDWNFAQYAFDFAKMFAIKWPAAEPSVPLLPAAIMMLFPIVMAIYALKKATSENARILIATLAALAITLAFHIIFGWQSFLAIGDMTVSQTRYYNTLWPGLALGGTVAIAHLRQRFRWASGLAAVYVAPTLVGGMALLAVGLT